MLRIKYTIQLVSLLIAVTMLIGGCKKSFLNTDPKGLLIAKKTSDYDLMLNDPTLVLVYPVSHILMSDEIAGSAEFFPAIGSGVGTLTDQKAFRWEDDLYMPSENNSEYTLLIKQAYIYNKIINEVMNSDDGSDAQKTAIRAEALAGRAYVHFMLANFYGKPYNSATSATDLGTPIAKVADITQTKYVRSTVQEMYNQIISDLNEALPNLPATVSSKVRMSKAAGEALLGKVYVFMGKFDLALPLMNASIADLANASMPVGLYNFNTELAAGGAFYPSNPIIGPPRNDAYKDKEIVYMKRNINFYNYVYSGAILSPEASRLFLASDLRKEFLTNFSFGMASVYPLGMLRAYGKGYNNMGVNVPDMYLLQAECKSRLGDTGGAATDLLAFRKTRISATDAVIPPGIASDKVALTKFILEERIREFAINGDRWFDMRRLSVDPEYKHTVGTSHKIYDNAGKVTETYTLKPERLTLRLPQYIMAANPGMPQNP